MNTLFYGSAIVSAAMLLSACGDSQTNVNVKVNRASSNTIGSISNSVGNAANTISNSVSNMTNSAALTPDAFIQEAAMGGMAEVEMGKIAAGKATNPEVKRFGQMMATDHSKANAELKALATKKGKTLPAEIDSSTKLILDDMKATSGPEFDTEYVEAMVEAHEKDVAEFEKQSQSAADADVKAFAAKTLPTLKKHLEQIKAIQAKMQ